MNTDAQLFTRINAGTDNEGWRILYYYNLYRLGLTVLLLVLASPIIQQISTAEASFTLLIPICGIAVISVLTFISIKLRRPALHIQAHFLFVLDIVFITMLTLSQHLLDSSTLILYVTTAAATAVLFHLKVSLAYTTAIAAVIFYKDYLEIVDGTVILENYYLTPLLVVGLYSVVVIVGTVANRSRVVQTVVEEQENVLADLDQINQVVLDQLDLGVIFLDQKLNIILINQSATSMISEFINDRNRLVGELSEVLSVYLKIPKSKGFNFRINNKELGFSTLPLRNGYLVQIEDQTSIQKQIQQSKLASIGRMASAISHEIRNPLSAINHAAQLLMPQNPEDSEDTELIQIIRTHSKRIDEIIESVLSRSRPGKAQRKPLQLQPWLKVFIDTFHETVSPGDVTLSTSGGDGSVMFDPTQLEQIITNLCQNSIKYAKPRDGKLKIRFYVGSVWDGTPYLDITDNGQGVKTEDIDMLFEPFHTSDSKSTGLGLFLVKEFCNFNGADIEYVKGTHRHGFRITFQQPGAENEQLPEPNNELLQQTPQEPEPA